MNKNYITTTLLLIVGIGTGFTTGYFISKKKYEAKADHEIQTVKDALNKRMQELADEIKKQPKDSSKSCGHKPTMKPSASTLDLNKNTKGGKPNYHDYAAPYRSDKEDERDLREVPGSEPPTPIVPIKPVKKGDSVSHTVNDGPYVISPDDYEKSDYEKSELVYYTGDMVLADSDFNTVKNPTKMVGNDALGSFGRYLEDIVYVRDDKLKIDYEITRDRRKFVDAAPYGAVAESHLEDDEDKDDNEESEDESPDR